MRHLIPIVFLALLTGSSWATVFEVGTGKAYTSLDAVPTESLAAGDEVHIFAVGGPYHAKTNITRVGTLGAHIKFLGIRDGFGNLPVIDGTNAITRPANPTNAYTEPLGIFVVYPGNSSPNTRPAYIDFDSLEIINAIGGGSVTYTGSDGVVHPYGYNPSDPTHPAVDASGIAMYRADHITITNCYIHNCGNCIFGKSDTFNPADSSDLRYALTDVRISGNQFINYGIVGSFREHAVYVEAIGAVYEGNYFGPPTPGSVGSALKDRSSGTIVRYNHIEGGQRFLDLVESQDGKYVLVDKADYNNAWVYGNLFDNRSGDAAYLVHWGGDTGATNYSWYKTGTLHFYHNTILSRRSSSDLFQGSLFDIADQPGIPTVEIDDNLWMITDANGAVGAGATSWVWEYTGGTTSVNGSYLFGHNYTNVPVGLIRAGSTSTGTTTGAGNVVTTGTVTFADAAAGDLHLVTGSTGAIGTATALTSGEATNPPTSQYVYPSGTIARATYGAGADLGALAYLNIVVTPPGPPAPAATAGGLGGLSGLSGLGALVSRIAAILVAINQVPAVTAGADQTITPPGVASLLGTATDDGLPSPPSILTLAWSKVSGPGTVTFGDATAAHTTATFSIAGTYVLQLSASDSVLTNSDALTVTVNAAGAANTAPVVSAGAAQTITFPAVANLSGTATDDGLPTPPGALTYAWSKVSGPGTVTFGSGASLSTTAAVSIDGAYVLRLTASDSLLSTSSDVSLTVNPAGSPARPPIGSTVNFAAATSLPSGATRNYSTFVNPANGDVYIGTGGTAIYKSSDEGTTWTALPAAAANRISWMAMNRLGQLVISHGEAGITGGSPIGIATLVAGAWREATGLTTPTDGFGQILLMPNGDLLTVTAFNGEVWHSTNDGASWTRMVTGNLYTNLGDAAGALFVLAYDVTHDRLYTGGEGNLLRSNDKGVTWARAQPINGHRNLQQLAIGGGIGWVVHSHKLIGPDLPLTYYDPLTGGASSPTGLDQYWLTTSLTQHLDDPSVMYLTEANTGPGSRKLLNSSDGLHWTAVPGNLATLSPTAYDYWFSTVLLKSGRLMVAPKGNEIFISTGVVP